MTGTASSLRPAVAIIADEEALAGALRDALATEGYHCSLCRCDATAGVAQAPDPPALILADISGGGTAAFALCQTLRERPDATSCHLLVLHRSGRSVDRRRAAALGADGFLAMPFALDDLRREVARLMSPLPI